MSKEIAALQIIDRIKNQLSKTWKDSSVDVFNTGNPNTLVIGIVTSYTPSIEVLRRSLAEGKNLIITQQPAFYVEDYTPAGVDSKSVDEIFKNDPTYLYKKDFIDKNKLVIWENPSGETGSSCTDINQ